MNKKKLKNYTFTLLPSIGFITELSQFNIQKFLFKIIQDKSSISEKTLRNTFNATRKPNKNTIDAIFSAIPDLIKSEYMSNFFKGEENPSDTIIKHMEHTEWEAILNSFYLGAGDYVDDFFPYFQIKIKELILIDKLMYLESKKAFPHEELIDTYKNNSLIGHLLSSNEKVILYSEHCTNEEAELIIFTSIYKVILYITAYIDAEFAYGYKNKATPRDKKQKIGKYSLIASILPIYEKERYIPPTERLFRKWKENHNTTYSSMQKFISGNGYEDIKSDSNKRKFLGWRRGENVANHEDILSIVKGICPEIVSNPTWATQVLTYYYVSLLYSNFFKVLQNAKVNEKKIFFSDEEIISWMHENYGNFFDEAYKKVDEFHKSA